MKRTLIFCSLLVALAILGNAFSVFASDNLVITTKTCVDETYHEYGEFEAHQLLFIETKTVTIGRDGFTYVKEFYWHESHTHGWWFEYRYTTNCEGATEYQFDDDECVTTFSEADWVKYVSYHYTDSDAGTFSYVDDYGRLVFIKWWWVYLSTGMAEIHYQIFVEETVCTEIIQKPTYSFVGINNGTPNTVGFIQDTLYECALSSIPGTRNPDIGQSRTLEGITDFNGNCWMAVRETNPDGTPHDTPNMWVDPGTMVRVVHEGHADAVFPVYPGFIYVVNYGATALDTTIVVSDADSHEYVTTLHFAGGS